MENYDKLTILSDGLNFSPQDTRSSIGQLTYDLIITYSLWKIFPLSEVECHMRPGDGICGDISCIQCNA